MILITSAKYLPPEFQIEFGKLPPSFLPLGTKRLYEYQISLFKEHNQKIILSLPKNFSLNKADKIKLKKLDVKVLFVDDNLSLGQSITHCLNMNLPINESLKILHGDTYISNISDIKNSLGVAKAVNNYNWSFVAQNKIHYIITHIDKNLEINLNEYVLNGFFNIENPYDFIKALSISNYNFMKGLQLYSSKYKFKLSVNNKWLDFGLLSSYFQSKKAITTQRVFNTLKIEQNWVIKTSNLKDKIKAEINWFEKFPSELSFFIPKFKKLSESSYASEYLYLNTLSEIFVFGNLPSFVWNKIFLCIKKFLDKLHSYKIDSKNLDSKINFDYKQKTLSRLRIFSKQANFDLNKRIILKQNNVIYKITSILEIIDKIDKFLPKKQDINNFCFIHGDFCFSNIMFDFKSNTLRCFDPRGIDFSNNITPFGDFRYDFAKIMHSCIGLYDLIIANFYFLKINENKFEITLNFTLEINENLKSIQNEFLRIFNPKKEIYAMQIHLFLSMIPLHNDNLNKQFALLANAIRLYKQFLDSIESKIDSE